MSSKENNEVAIDKIENDQNSGDAKCEIKGTKRTAEVRINFDYQTSYWKLF